MAVGIVSGSWTEKTGIREYKFALKGTSVDAAMCELTTDGNVAGVGNVITPPVGVVWHTLITVACICTAGTDIGKSAAWLISAAISNLAGTTVLLWPGQTLDVSHLWTDGLWRPSHYSDGALATMIALPDATGVAGYFRMRGQGVVGGAANTFKWSCLVHAIEAG